MQYGYIFLLRLLKYRQNTSFYMRNNVYLKQNRELYAKKVAENEKFFKNHKIFLEKTKFKSQRLN